MEKLVLVAGLADEVVALIGACQSGFTIRSISSADGQCTQGLRPAAVIVDAHRDDLLSAIISCVTARTFVIALCTQAATAQRRLRCFRAGASMVAASVADVATALARVGWGLARGGPYACPQCGLDGLDEHALREHFGLYHAAAPNFEGRCPVCLADCSGSRYPLVVHLNQQHGPRETREPAAAAYPAFAWVVCRRPSDGSFLIVNEPAGVCRSREPGYWLPAGRLDAGESLVEAARRECLEEAGVAATPVGVLRLMVDDDIAPRVIRAALLAVPEDAEANAKAVPDYESVGATWIGLADLATLATRDYRSPDPAELYPRVADGTLRPCSLETAAWHELEALLRRLTHGDRGARSELPAVWRRVKATYPEAVLAPG